MKPTAVTLVAFAAAATVSASHMTKLQNGAILIRGGTTTESSSSLFNNSNSNSNSNSNDNSTSSTTTNQMKKQQQQQQHPKQHPNKKRTKKNKATHTSHTEATTNTTSSMPQNDPHNKLIEEILSHADNYYAILGIQKTATLRDITKSYRKRALQTHPDKTNGDRRAFDKVAEAHHVLSDETKRPLYDRYGMRGLEQQQQRQQGTSSEDLFRAFFGQSSQHSAPRNKNTKYQLEVTLEELYSGMTRSILVEQPGSNHRKSVQVHIPRGMTNGETVVLSGEMDAIEQATPGDLIFLLAQRHHSTFTRKGHDLAVEIIVTLSEAFCGFQGSIQHLDGRVLTISSARDNHSHDQNVMMIQTGDVHVLKGEGMPKRESGEFGDLYVQYTVELPQPNALQRLNAQERAQLGTLLNKLEGKQSKNVDGDPIVLQKANVSDFGVASGILEMQQDESQEESHAPFRGARSFYWSNTERRGASNNPFERNPFFASSRSGNDSNENVQCQQM
jgi:DnaJ-class molecular chaperone